MNRSILPPLLQWAAEGWLTVLITTMAVVVGLMVALMGWHSDGAILIAFLIASLSLPWTWLLMPLLGMLPSTLPHNVALGLSFLVLSLGVGLNAVLTYILGRLLLRAFGVLPYVEPLAPPRG